MFCFRSTGVGTPRLMSGPSRHVRTWVLWWIALFWLWMLLAGEWNRIELVAAAIVATVGAAFAVIAILVTDFELRVPFDVLRAARSMPLMVFVDFGILTY